MEYYETIIIGGGPAGITCGFILNQKNKKCLIIDKQEFPREKLCGGGLTPKTYELINNIYFNLKYSHKKINNVLFYYNDKKVNFINLKKGIRTVVRSNFDLTLMNEYINSKGIFIIDEIKLIEEYDSENVLTLKSGKKLSCKYLVGADGALSCVRKHIDPNYFKGVLCLEQHNEKHKKDEIIIGFDDSFNNGYFFSFPNESYNAIGYGDKKTNIENFDRQLEVYNIISNNKTRGAYVPMLVKLNYKFKDNILLIGDAGSYVDSITGEGLYYAIKTGQNAALSIINNIPFKIQNKKIIRRVKQKRILSVLFYSKFGKTLTKIFLKNRWISSKVVNWYLCH